MAPLGHAGGLRKGLLMGEDRKSSADVQNDAIDRSGRRRCPGSNKRYHRIPDFFGSYVSLCADRAGDVGLLSPLPMFEIYLRSARHSCRVFRVVLFQFLSAAGQTKASKRLHNCLAGRPRLEATADRLMARFYFDFGEELPSATIARKEALKTVGLAVKDLTYRHAEGRVVIEVRDGDGPFLRVLAVVETTSLKE